MIKNRTRKTILCRRTELAKSIWKKSLGLMFRKELKKDQGMLFFFSYSARHSFWTPFLRFPIDIIYIDSSRRVVDIKNSVKPWRTCLPSAGAKYVLELRAGTARKAKTSIGDLLEFGLAKTY